MKKSSFLPIAISGIIGFASFEAQGLAVEDNLMDSQLMTLPKYFQLTDSPLTCLDHGKKKFQLQFLETFKYNYGS